MISFSEAVRTWFRHNGWTDRYTYHVPDHIPPSHPAHETLRQFGGITLLEFDCLAGDAPIEEFAFRPSLATSRVISEWSERLGSRLISIADQHNGHAELFIDETGRCFAISCVHNAFWFSGDSLGDTLEGVINQRRVRPLLAPHQDEVHLYGEWISEGDPRIYDYRRGNEN